MSRAAGDYNSGAIEATNGLNQTSAGNDSVALPDVEAAGTAIRKGNAAVQAATVDIQSFQG